MVGTGFADIAAGYYALQVDDLTSLPTLSHDTFNGSTIQVAPSGVDRLSTCPNPLQAGTHLPFEACDQPLRVLLRMH